MNPKLLVPAFFLVSMSALAQLAPNAPKDEPQLHQGAQVAALEKAMAPYIAKAKQTYPAARGRYLAGLPRGETFFVTTQLHDKDNRMEQIFVRVLKIEDGKITGSIASQVQVVAGYRQGQQYTFPESEIVDWLISKPDGTEEGNVVGKFMETYRP